MCGKNRQYWVDQYKKLIAKYWNIVPRNSKSSLLVLLDIDSKLKGSYNQKAEDFSCVKVVRKINTILDYKLDPKVHNVGKGDHQNLV